MLFNYLILHEYSQTIECLCFRISKISQKAPFIGDTPDAGLRLNGKYRIIKDLSEKEVNGITFCSGRNTLYNNHTE
jgi:hypothetical protein